LKSLINITVITLWLKDVLPPAADEGMTKYITGLTGTIFNITG